MSNFYRDNPDISFHISNARTLSRVVELKEDGFAEKERYPGAPQNIEDALDNYDKILEIVGDIAGKYVAPRAAAVDQMGVRLVRGEVILAKGTQEALDRLKESELMGFTLPRKYGGINMPKTVYSAAIEIISRADASLMNLFGLQEIADTICRFGSDDQKERFLPKFSAGEATGAMTLTEPDAGSDLQAVMLKATQEADGQWYLDGVKRFITNGCGEISLIMARSEEGSSGGRGLSLFIYERDGKMTIRRLEHKLGIHGSPTCELQFNHAKAELLGQRKMGLIKYAISLMNGARLAVAAQAIGIADAAYRQADSYARHREQFKKKIREFAAVYEMLTDMRINIEAARSLLYETSRIVDIKEGIEDRVERRKETASDLKEDGKRYGRFAALFTPMLKVYATEMANQVCDDAIQVHGGVGYTREFDVERHFRDARVTNIYEGTTQLQVLAAIGGVLGGVVTERLNEYEADNDFSAVADLFKSAQAIRLDLEIAVTHVRGKSNQAYQEYHSRRLVDMAIDAVASYLLCMDALRCARKKIVAQAFISKAKYRARWRHDYIVSDDTTFVEFHDRILE